MSQDKKSSQTSDNLVADVIDKINKKNGVSPEKAEKSSPTSSLIQAAPSATRE